MSDKDIKPTDPDTAAKNDAVDTEKAAAEREATRKTNSMAPRR